MENINLMQNSNLNNFDKDIIQQQSYKIINENTLLKNNYSNNETNSLYNSNKPKEELTNNYKDNYNEDDNINLNININNYLSKRDNNITSGPSSKNNQKTKKQKYLKRTNTGKNRGYLLPNSSRNININNKIRNMNNKKPSNDIMKLKLLERMRQQKDSLKNFDYKVNNLLSNNRKNKEELLSKKGIKNENGKNQKKQNEETKHIPKILTFLRTFKNFALPLKSNNNKKDNQNNNKKEKENESNFIINPNNSCFNFNSKLKPNVGKLNLDNRIIDNSNNKYSTDKNDINDENEGDDFIDYNRFTFRNNIDEDNSSSSKTIEDDDKIDKFDNDMNQNINIDEYNKRNNNYYSQKNIKNDINNKYINDDYIKNYNNKRLKEIQLSPNFKQKKIKTIYTNNNATIPYFRKKYLKNKYNSPKPEPKHKINNSSNYTYNNIVKNNKINNNKQQIDYYNNNYNNQNDDSFQSLNISKRYRKPILNNSFQTHSHYNMMNKNNSYYNNDISVDGINLSNNYYSTNRSLKNNKIHEIVINMNDSLDSFNNDRNYNTQNHLYSNRSPLKKKIDYPNTNSSYYMKRSPFSSKQNGAVNDFSDNYDTNNMEYEHKNNFIKKNTNFSRFMAPFQKNENKKWYNEDSYYSYDIININNNAKNNNLLYHKPLRGINNKHLNKNNSMYIKRIVHYDNNKSSFLNDSDYKNDSDYNKYKSRLNNNDYDEKENNVYDFDAPRAIKDSIDDINNNNSEFISNSERENQLSINSDISTNKLNDSISTNNQKNGNNSNVYVKKNTQNLSNRNPEKIVYMKKLNTVYNFYKGTKNLFSKLNEKVFKIHKKDDNKNINNYNNDTKNNDKKNDDNNNIINNNTKNKNDILIYQGEITPRARIENEENNSSYFTKNSVGTPFVEQNNKKIDNDLFINRKKINNKKCFMKKYRNLYLTKSKNKNKGIYFSKITFYQQYKIPKIALYYMTKERLKIYQIPLNNKKCYFQKVNIINNNKNNIDEHEKICSFFSIGGVANYNYNDNINDNNNSKDAIKQEDNKSIKNLKQNIFVNDKQVNLLLSNDIDKIDNYDNNIDKYSFSFKDNKNTTNNNLSNDIFEKVEIKNFYFTLSPKKINNEFENNKKIPEKNNNLIIINNKDDRKKIYKYDYILSLKNNKFSENNNLLPEKVLCHLNNLNKEKEIISFSFEKNNKDEENKLKKKYKKGEIQKLIKKYLTPNKNEDMNNIINKQYLTDNTNKNKEIESNEKKPETIEEPQTQNFDVKLKMEWIRNDLSKEIEQAENYIKEFKKKIEENTKKNDIICLLNMLTVDNLKSILNKIIELIIKNKEEILPNKDIIDNEYILIKIIVDKAITEKRFVNLYAKLCYELYNLLGDKNHNDINFKTILMEECKIKFNDINNINNNDDNNKINLDDEKYYDIKKKFLGNIDFICELINVNILSQDIGFYYLEELFKKYNNINTSNQFEKFKKYLCLEAIVNFLSKFGKKIYENKNINNFKYLNYYIENNLNPILKNEDLPGFLKYKIINLIEKQKNKWKDSLYEKSILAKGKKNSKKNFNSTSVNKIHRLRKKKQTNKGIKSISPDNFISNQNILENNNRINTYKNINNYNNNINNIIAPINIITNNNNEEIIKLIEKDLEKYDIFLKENNITNKSELDKNNQIGNDYDWSTIEDILSKNNNDLGELIRCYVEVCIDQITNNLKIFFANDYIKNIINYYSNNLTNKEKDIIHNKMINLFMNIQDICIDNFNMKEIMGYLLFILIDNKLSFIKDLNNFIGMDQEIIITMAEVIKYAIISSEAKCKKYHNDFKQTKLFVDNSIFNDYVTNKIQDSINHF